MDAGAVLERPQGVGQGGEVQACGEAHEAPGDVLDVPFDGGGGLGLDAADEGGGIAQGRSGSLDDGPQRMQCAARRVGIIFQETE